MFRHTFRAFALFAGLSTSLAAFAQSEEDALRMSRLAPGGTARSAALGNAFGALGADPSSISINPAGFGLYRTSELSLTPAFEVHDAENVHYGTKAFDTGTRFHFSNLALVINNPAESGRAWRGSTYGVVYDRRASHHLRRTALGERVPSTILEGFAAVADGTPSGNLSTRFPFTSGLAWDTYAIDPWYVTDPNGNPVPDLYIGAIPFGSDTRQTHTVESSGATTSTAFFYSGNYKDRMFLGASVGITGHRYQRTTVHREASLDESLALRDVTYREDLSTSGNGFDLKLGLIGHATDRLRVGFAFHGPQWLRLNDGYLTEMRTNWRRPPLDTTAAGRLTFAAASPDGQFSYRTHTPWRTVLSVAYIAGSSGLVSLDYEYADFRQARFRPSNRMFDSYDFAAENDAILASFRPVHSLRAGTEWRLGRWYYRMGVGFVPDAHMDDDPRQGTALKTFAAGIGYRSDHFSLDLGLVHTQNDVRYFQYAWDLVEPTAEKRRTYLAMLTFGVRA